MKLTINLQSFIFNQHKYCRIHSILLQYVHCRYFSFLRMLYSFPAGDSFQTEGQYTNYFNLEKVFSQRTNSDDFVGCKQLATLSFYLGYPLVHPAFPIIPTCFSLCCCRLVLLKSLLQRVQHCFWLLQGSLK